MRWILAILFLTMLNIQEDSAFPLLTGKRIKKLLDTVLGVEKWSLAMTSGDDVEETANIAEKMQKIIIQSNNLPETSDMDNSTILMDFKKGMMAALFLDTDMGHMCFFTEDDSSFGPSAAEIIGRKNATTPVQLGNPVTYYALNSHRVMTGPALLKMGGVAVFKMCGHCIDNGKVYHVVKDSTAHMKPRTLTASGFVSATQPGKSVPIIFNMEEDSMGDNVIHNGMSAHAQMKGNDKDMTDKSMAHDMGSDMNMMTDDTQSSILVSDSVTDDKTKILKLKNTDDKTKTMKLTNTDDKTMTLTNTDDKTKTLTNTDDKTMTLTNKDDKTKKLTNTDDKTMTLTNKDDKTKKLTNTDDKTMPLTNKDDKTMKLSNTEDKTKTMTLTNSDDKTKTMKITNTDDKKDTIKIANTDDKTITMKLTNSDDKAMKITNTDDKKSVNVDSGVNNMQIQQSVNVVTTQSPTGTPKSPIDTTTGTVAMTTTPSITTMSLKVIGSESPVIATDMTSAPVVTMAPSTMAPNTAGSSIDMNMMKEDDTAVSMDTKDSFGTAMAVPISEDKMDKSNS